MKYKSPIPHGSQAMTKVKVKTSRSRSLGQKLWKDVKGIVTRNARLHYESPSSYGLKVMANV